MATKPIFLLDDEWRILPLLVQGVPVEQIAEQLDMPLGLVLFHRYMLCMKAHTQRRSGLKAFARQFDDPDDS